MVNTIICPHCKNSIELTEALTHQIQEKLVASLNQKHEKELEEVKQKLLDQIKKESEEQFALELTDLKKQLEEKEQKVAEFRGHELKLREEKRKLEEREQELKLEVQRKIDEERKKIEESVLKQAIEEHRLKDLEKEKIIQDLKRGLEEAQRRAQLSSQQLQGEVLELDLEHLLRSSFPQDVIEPIGKGAVGSDIRHMVKSPRGTLCGVVLWECKRTKAWSSGWIPKLKDDLRREKAHIPVIVTTTLPEEAKTGMGMIDGVWVCSFSLVFPLAMLLRKSLLDVAFQKAVSLHKGEKAELLYEFVTSHEFIQQVEALLEVYRDMQEQLVRERSVFEKSWKQREAQMRRYLTSLASVYGTMQGLAGSSMPQIKGFEMMELESGGG